MRELLILRHAKSDWSTGEADFDRPLNNRGKNDAPRMGRWLRDEGLIPDTVISSPATRARSTTLAVTREVSFAESKILWKSEVYEASVEQLMALLRHCPTGSERVLLVGHNPGLGQLLMHLCPDTAIPADGKLLPTCTVARLQVGDDWAALSAGSAGLLGLMRPRELPG